MAITSVIGTIIYPSSIEEPRQYLHILLTYKHLHFRFVTFAKISHLSFCVSSPLLVIVPQVSAFLTG